MKNFLSPAIYGVIILCFFLPWVSVSCQGQPIVTFSGFQLAKGTTFDQPKSENGGRKATEKGSL
jgi:hypothetical protein